MAREPLLIRWLGRVGYTDALRLQESLVLSRRKGASPDTLLLLEHPPVVTLGRRGDPDHVLLDRDELGRRGVELHETGRGGDVTFHGPGQLVGYPVVLLPPKRRDAHRYLRDLEDALIAVVASYSLDANRIAGLTGVWVGGAKLAAIGVRLNTGWITSHGFALNVSTDLAQFETIVPCGISDRAVTSLGRLLGNPPDLREVAARVAVRVAAVLGLEPTLPDTPAERLGEIEDEPLSWPDGDMT
jgi:lipoyl(octanoyl) transferase